LRHLSVPADHGDDGLFEMSPVVPPEVLRGPVDKTFRPFQPDQIFLVPPSLDEWLPREHLARFIADLVDEHLDLSAFYADYREGRGAPPFDPRLMVRVLLLGYIAGVRSSRKLEQWQAQHDERASVEQSRQHRHERRLVGIAERGMASCGEEVQLVTVVAVAAGHGGESQPDDERSRDRRVPSPEDHRRTLRQRTQP
jgi:hypothetical protein